MHVTLKPLCGSGGGKKKVGEMTFRAANVSLHSVRQGKVPAEEAALRQGKKRFFFFFCFV